MQRIEVNGLVYEFKDDMALMSLLDENADRVYEGIVTEKAPPNDPLTLEELREMDGEPVWVTSVNNGRGRSWTLVDTKYEICREVHGGLAVFENYGKTWLAYRRKPEEGGRHGNSKMPFDSKRLEKRPSISRME